MNSVKCPNCGLVTRSTHSECQQCRAPLNAIAASNASASHFLNLTTILILAGVAVMATLVIGASIAAYHLYTVRKVGNVNAAFETAIRSSAEFNQRITVEAGRYTFYNRDENRFDQEATPAAYALDGLGLLYIHTSVYSDVPTTLNSEGKVVIDPATGLVPFEYKHTRLELTQSGQAESVAWEGYEIKKDGKVGWKVPIGGRQLLRVVQVLPLPEGQPLGDAAMISFTWKWKPNQVGESFDKRSPAYATPHPPQGYSRSVFDLEVNDSQAVYWGTAELHRAGGSWEAHRFSWHGTGGVTISPNMSDEIDKIVKQSQDR